MTLSKTMIAALMLGAGLAGSASAMNAGACRDFVRGTWAMKSAIPGEQLVKVTYNADGTYQIGKEAGGAPEAAATGSWEAKAGVATDCEVLLTPAAAAPRAVNFTKTGPDGFKTAEGDTATREPDAEPALIN